MRTGTTFKTVLVVAAAGVAWIVWFKYHSYRMSGLDSAGEKIQPGQLVIQTGQERMSNAVRCLSYTMDMASKLPEKSPARRQAATIAGLLFFEDCLMSKMSHGYITTTTQEVCQSFSNAVFQVMTNQVPPALAHEIEHPQLNYISPGFPSEALNDWEKLMDADCNLAMAWSFYTCFSERSDVRMTEEDKYKQIGMKDALNSAFDKLGIKDNPHSDLKDLCLTVCSFNTSTDSIYGPKTAWSNPEEHQNLTESVDKIFEWRLVNIHGLEESKAKALVKAVSHLYADRLTRDAWLAPAHIR